MFRTVRNKMVLGPSLLRRWNTGAGLVCLSRYLPTLSDLRLFLYLDSVITKGYGVLNMSLD